MEEEIELIDYLKVLWKRKILILAGTLICVLAAGVKIYSMTPLYEASAKILITKPKYQIKSESNIETNLNQIESLKTYIEFFKSSKIADKVLKTLQLDKDPYNLTAGAIRGSGELKQISGTNIIQLSVSFGEPKITADIANTWAKEFLLYNEDIYSRDTKDTKNLIGRQINDVKTELLKLGSQIKLNEEKKIPGFADIIENKKSVLVRLSKTLDQSMFEKSNFENGFSGKINLLSNGLINNQVSILNSKKLSLESHKEKLSFITNEIKKRFSDLSKTIKGKDMNSDLGEAKFQIELTSLDIETQQKFNFTTNQNPVTIKLEMEKTSIESIVHSLQEEISMFESSLPELRKFLEQLKQLKLEEQTDIPQLVNTLQTGLIKFSGMGVKKLTYSPELNSKYVGRIFTSLAKSGDAEAAKLSQQSHNLIDDLLNYYQLGRSISTIREGGNALNGEIRKMKGEYTEASLVSERLNRIYDNKKSALSMLQKKYEELKLSASSMHSIGEIIEEATIPEFPSKPNKRKLLMIAFAAGMFLSIFIAFFTEYIQNSIAKQKV